MQTQQFQKGVFRAYRAVTKIHLGRADVDVYSGDIIEFDGFTIRVAGQDYVDPAVRGAINARWFVPEADNVSQYVAQRADIRLRPATNAGGKADQVSSVVPMSEEEREVGSLSITQAKREAAGANPTQHTASTQDRDAKIAALEAEIARLKGASAKPSVGVAIAEDDFAFLEEDPAEEPPSKSPKPFKGKVMADVADQEAVPVARILTPAVKNYKATEQEISSAAAKLKADGEALKVVPIREPKSVRLASTAATGDVLESREALDVADLLPDAAKAMPKGKSGIVNTEGGDKVPSTVVFVTKADGTKEPWNKNQHWKVRIRQLLERFKGDISADDKILAEAILAIEDATVVREFKRLAGWA